MRRIDRNRERDKAAQSRLSLSNAVLPAYDVFLSSFLLAGSS